MGRSTSTRSKWTTRRTASSTTTHFVSSLEFGDETYRYKIVGNELTLEPVIPPRSKREALANPLEFGLAGHAAAVAYAGHAWKRVDCGDWC